MLAAKTWASTLDLNRFLFHQEGGGGLSTTQERSCRTLSMGAVGKDWANLSGWGSNLLPLVYWQVATNVLTSQIEDSTWHEVVNILFFWKVFGIDFSKFCIPFYLFSCNRRSFAFLAARGSPPQISLQSTSTTITLRSLLPIPILELPPLLYPLHQGIPTTRVRFFQTPCSRHYSRTERPLRPQTLL